MRSDVRRRVTLSLLHLPYAWRGENRLSRYHPQINILRDLDWFGVGVVVWNLASFLHRRVWNLGYRMCGHSLNELDLACTHRRLLVAGVGLECHILRLDHHSLLRSRNNRVLDWGAVNLVLGWYVSRNNLLGWRCVRNSLWLSLDQDLGDESKRMNLLVGCTVAFGTRITSQRACWLFEQKRSHLSSQLGANRRSGLWRGPSFIFLGTPSQVSCAGSYREPQSTFLSAHSR